MEELDRRLQVTYVPDAVIDDEELTIYEMAAYLAIARFCNKEAAAFPGMATIAKRGKMSDNAARRAVRGLEKKGYIAVTRRTDPENPKRNLSNLYTLTDPTVSQTGGGASQAPGWDPTGPRGGASQGEEGLASEGRVNKGGEAPPEKPSKPEEVGEVKDLTTEVRRKHAEVHEGHLGLLERDQQDMARLAGEHGRETYLAAWAAYVADPGHTREHTEGELMHRGHPIRLFHTQLNEYKKKAEEAAERKRTEEADREEARRREADMELSTYYAAVEAYATEVYGAGRTRESEAVALAAADHSDTVMRNTMVCRDAVGDWRNHVTAEECEAVIAKHIAEAVVDDDPFGKLFERIGGREKVSA